MEELPYVHRVTLHCMVYELSNADYFLVEQP